MERLPDDLLAAHITYLTFKDVVSLCKTNHRMLDFCMARNKDGTKTPSERRGRIWESLIYNTFGGIIGYKDKLLKISKKFR